MQVKTRNLFCQLLLANIISAAIFWLAGCVEVDGGAIEVGWEIRHADPQMENRRLSCLDSNFIAVRLVLEETSGTVGDPCEQYSCGEENCCRFDCEPEVGITGFYIPDGVYKMSIQPIDVEGKEPSEAQGIIVPAPVVREVTKGDITNLGVNLIIVNL